MNKARFHVLLVEDDPNDAFFIRRALKHAGYGEVIECGRNGDEAIAYLSKSGVTGGDYRVLIMDLTMPRGDGFSVLKWMREHQMTMPVVVHSASDQPENITRVHELGAVFARKVPGYGDLVVRLDELLKRLPNPERDAS
jgi:DNA-binding response OmpR family regulator